MKASVFSAPTREMFTLLHVLNASRPLLFCEISPRLLSRFRSDPPFPGFFLKLSSVFRCSFLFYTDPSVSPTRLHLEAYTPPTASTWRACPPRGRSVPSCFGFSRGFFCLRNPLCHPPRRVRMESARPSPLKMVPPKRAVPFDTLLQQPVSQAHARASQKTFIAKISCHRTVLWKVCIPL